MTFPRPSAVLRSPAFWIAAGVAGRHAVGVWHLRRTLALLSQAPSTGTPTGIDTDATVRRIHFIIPALREQEHVGAAMRWFAVLLGELPGSTLTVVTTAREERERELLLDRLAGSRPVTARRFPQLSDAELRALAAAQVALPHGVLLRPAAAAVLSRFPFTREVVADHLASPDLVGAPIRQVVYPGEGRKAAQVNHAVAQLADPGEYDYVAVYDVDSRPDLALVRRTLALIADRERLDGEPPAVVQQSARFATAGAAARAWERAVCRGSARLQTLWTLRRELPSFGRYARATRRSAGRGIDAVSRGLAQTVGHGLLVRVDVYRRVGGLPEFTVLDDLPFGYRLTIEGIPVDVVAATTKVPAPEHVGDLIAMNRRWFHNYLDYPACAAAARANNHGTSTSRALALAVAGYRATAWVLASPATVAAAALLLRPRTPAPARVMAAAGLWLGCVTPVRMMTAADGHRPAAAEQARDSAEVFTGYLFTSIGPLTALAAAPRRRPETFSPKTQRRSLLPTKEPS